MVLTPIPPQLEREKNHIFMIIYLYLLFTFCLFSSLYTMGKVYVSTVLSTYVLIVEVNCVVYYVRTIIPYFGICLS